MSHGWRQRATVLACLQALCLTGCASTTPIALRGDGPTESLAADLADDAGPRVARMQRPQLVPAVPAPKTNAAPAAPAAPPPITSVPASPAPSYTPKIGAPAPAPSVRALPVSLSSPKARSLTVRAWVNGRPIFDDEVMQSIPRGALMQIERGPESQRMERLADLFNQTLDQIIEQEVVYQEAVRKLQNQPLTLAKLKRLAEEDFEKQLERVAKQVPDEELKEVKRAMRKQMERSFIAMEYMRSRIFPSIQRIGYQEIQDYYDAHQSEFTKVESVKWQNVFIAVGPKYPTLAQAKRFAEDLIAQCRTTEDFAKLSQYDDGDAKFRNGEGLGSRRGEIKPAEIEEHLFKLRDGEIGPVVELSTGVHIFRLVSRDPGGLQPLNEQVQAQIRNKLRSMMADREYKRVIRELRSRAVVEVERDT